MIDDEIIDVLDDAIKSAGVMLGWISTWGFRISRIEELLGGRLRGGFVVAERPGSRFVSADWKYTAVVKVVEQHPGARIGWADDDAIPVAAVQGRPSKSFADAVLIAPDGEDGLTLTDARRMRDHLIGQR